MILICVFILKIYICNFSICLLLNMFIAAVISEILYTYLKREQLVHVLFCLKQYYFFGVGLLKVKIVITFFILKLECYGFQYWNQHTITYFFVGHRMLNFALVCFK